MWTKIITVIITFLSKFVNDLISNRIQEKKLEDLGFEKAKNDALEEVATRDEAADKETEKPILKGQELIDDLKRKRDNHPSN